MSAQPSLFDGALAGSIQPMPDPYETARARVRTTDPQTSVDAAKAQAPRATEHDILVAIAKRGHGLADLTAHEIWARYMGWREPSTVKSAMSRLKDSGLVVVTGSRIPERKRVAQSTYALTDAGWRVALA